MFWNEKIINSERRSFSRIKWIRTDDPIALKTNLRSGDNHQPNEHRTGIENVFEPVLETKIRKRKGKYG